MTRLSSITTATKNQRRQSSSSSYFKPRRTWGLFAVVVVSLVTCRNAVRVNKLIPQYRSLLGEILVEISSSDSEISQGDSTQVQRQLSHHEDSNSFERQLRDQFGHMFGATLDVLFNISTRYFVYQEEALDQPGYHVDNSTEIDYLNLAPDAETEMMIINSLKQHPLRTYNPEEATFFVIPLCHVAIKANPSRMENVTYQAAFDALKSSPWWQRNLGKDHILISTWWGRFEQRMFTEPHGLEDAMNPYYPMLWNVTIAAGKSRHGIQKLFERGKHPNFQHWFRYEALQMSWATFSLGNIPTPGLPFIKPTYEKFHNSQYFLFYHIRPTKYHTPNSTEFRRKALQDDVIAALPHSSIGYDLPKTQWLEHISNSKFCLVMRGDDPKSHALLRSVKVGCIPVVISDAYPDYAPTLESSIKMEDYCIFIKEADFWRDPAGSLATLTTLSKDYVQKKLLGVSWAQHVLIPDHPQSLFVPAFLRETQVAQQRARSEPTIREYNKKGPKLHFRPKNMRPYPKPDPLDAASR